MISLEEAQGAVLAACAPLPPSRVPLGGALGVVLAEAVTASDPVPPFRNSAMDGYAVRAGDLTGASTDAPARLAVAGTQAAGAGPGPTVGPGRAVRIMTGALVPEGADSIAIVETTRIDGDDVLIDTPVDPGAHIREPGGDIAAGQEVFGPGTHLRPGHLGVLASVGRSEVAAHRTPVVGVLSTGDELVPAGVPLPPGGIRDSNRATLLALLHRDGFAPVDLGIAPDDEAAIEAALRAGTQRCDAVMTSGGVSMGDYDYVKVVLDRIGAMRWMQVAIRPAKPFAFGTVGSTPVFGLPGNPVSSMVSYELLARPGLRRMAGHPDAALHRRPVPAVVAGSGWRAAHDGRTAFTRVTTRFDADGRLRAESSGGQGSHQLYAMALADALAVSAPGADAAPGDAVQVLLLAP